MESDPVCSVSWVGRKPHYKAHFTKSLLDSYATWLYSYNLNTCVLSAVFLPLTTSLWAMQFSYLLLTFPSFCCWSSRSLSVFFVSILPVATWGEVKLLCLLKASSFGSNRFYIHYYSCQHALIFLALLT